MALFTGMSILSLFEFVMWVANIPLALVAGSSRKEVRRVGGGGKKKSRQPEEKSQESS